MQTVLVLVTTISFVALLVAFVKLRGQREDSARKGERTVRRKRLQRGISSTAGRVDLARSLVDVDGACGLGVDARAGTLLLFDADGAGELSVKVIDGRDVLGAEVVQHVFGDAQKGGTEVCVAGVDLVVLLADRQVPARVLSLLDGRTEYGSAEHRAARDEAYAVAALVKAVSRRGAAVDRSGEVPAPSESEKERARELAGRYLTHRGRVEDELAERQVRRGGEPTPAR